MVALQADGLLGILQDLSSSGEWVARKISEFDTPNEVPKVDQIGRISIVPEQ